MGWEKQFPVGAVEVGARCLVFPQLGIAERQQEVGEHPLAFSRRSQCNAARIFRTELSGVVLLIERLILFERRNRPGKSVLVVQAKP